MNKQHICKILSKEKLKDDIFRFTISAPEISGQAVPGQFMEVKCGDGIEPLLRRPFGISGINKENGEAQFIIQVKGNATQLLSRKEKGQELDILGPMGHGFTLSEKVEKTAIIGGGIGIFPLLYLAKELDKLEKDVFFGFKDKESIILENEFKELSDGLYIATDDGSYGFNGLVTEILEEHLVSVRYDRIYACGPRPMLKKVSEIAMAHNIDCEISTEERMCCGVGACLGCACKLRDGGDWKYGLVCKNGPVFNVNEIILE